MIEAELPRHSGNEEYVFSRTLVPRGFSVSRDELKQILFKLQRLVRDLGEAELAKIPCPPDQDPVRWEKDKREALESAFRVTTTVYGHGQRDTFHPEVGSVFADTAPQRIHGIFATNMTAFSGFFQNRQPRNSFELTLDFKNAPLLDSRNPVSDPTPNGSHIEIRGINEAWVASVEAAIMDTLTGHDNHRRVLHRAFVYDLGLLLVALPAYFYVASLIERFHWTSRLGLTSLTSAAFYVYAFFFVLWVYRVLFGYTKWAFPIMELLDKYNATSTHRRIWAALVISIVSAFIYDLAA